MMDPDRDDEKMEVSSPACAMHEASDVYMGYAGKEELVAALNELLEAERAGAGVARATAAAAGDAPIAALMGSIHKDESHWCAMLSRHIKELGGTPSPRVGGFHDRAMAIADLGVRVDFLNRGQGWVVRKLEELTPRVRDDRLHADLKEMLRSHEANIALASEVRLSSHALAEDGGRRDRT